jgi:predicted DNA-binding transcriptional regulator AlpA
MEKLNYSEMEKLMDKKRIATAFGVTVKVVDKWVCEKKIPHIKISPKCVRFRPSAIKAYLYSRTVNLKYGIHLRP